MGFFAVEHVAGNEALFKRLIFHSTCTSCSKKSCHSYSCNCYCCQSLSNRLCQATCKSCWNPSVMVSLPLQSQELYYTNISNSCGTDYSCVNNFLNRYELNTTKACFYAPWNPSLLAFSNDITKWKMDLMWAFVGTTISFTFLFVFFGSWAGIGMICMWWDGGD
jgi:hypothetical protein